MGMLVSKSDLGFGDRSWRYSMLVDDGVVEKMFIEPDLLCALLPCQIGEPKPGNESRCPGMDGIGQHASSDLE